MKVSEIISGAKVVSAGRVGYKPKISVITPTYCRNAEGLLLRCLDSAAVQTFQDFEHIIIDDGSSDGSEAVLTHAAIRDDRIVYVRHERNSGLPGVRTNEGILRARGDAIAFLFDDNIYDAHFLEKAWAALNASGADVVVTNVEMLTKAQSFTLGGWPQTIEMMRELNSIPNGGVLVRRSFLSDLVYTIHISYCAESATGISGFERFAWAQNSCTSTLRVQSSMGSFRLIRWGIRLPGI